MSAHGVLWLAVGLLALFVVYAIPWWVQGKRDEKRLADHERANANERLAKLFDGASTVAYVPTESSGGLPVEMLIKAADDRGYRFVAETGRGITRRVIFERVSGA